MKGKSVEQKNNTGIDLRKAARVSYCSFLISKTGRAGFNMLVYFFSVDIYNAPWLDFACGSANRWSRVPEMVMNSKT